MTKQRTTIEFQRKQANQHYYYNITYYYMGLSSEFETAHGLLLFAAAAGLTSRTLWRRRVR